MRSAKAVRRLGERLHRLLPPNIGSPRDAATLGEIGSAFPATQPCFATLICVLFLFLASTKKGRGVAGCNEVTRIIYEFPGYK